jgi:peptide/nickel transport system permease protein
MIGFLIRRIFQAIIVILGVILILFILSKQNPRTEIIAALGPRANPAEIHHFQMVNGLLLPIWDQLWRYVEGLVVHLNLGYSYHYNQGVREIISERLPKTLTLVGASTVVALLIAVPLGVVQTVWRHKPIDYALTTVTFVGYAMPAFLLGTLLIQYFAFNIKLFPVSPPPTATAWTIFTDPRAFVLPMITLSGITIASFSRYMRRSMLDAMAEDYVRTARAKGASNKRVLYGHALRNALIPILVLVGLSLPAIVGGALITETVFNYPGMGLLTVQAAFNTDIPVVLGTTLVITVAVVVGSLMADILCAVADPRIRLGSSD